LRNEEQPYQQTVVLDGEEYQLQTTQKTIFLLATNPDHKDQFFFKCFLDDSGVLELSISTSHSENKSRAPGLYASELVGIALGYFEKKQREVKAIRGYWTKDRYSDNYIQYIKAISMGPPDYKLHNKLGLEEFVLIMDIQKSLLKKK
jgi:hypothetical protein